MTNWKINPKENNGNLKNILNKKYGKKEFSMNLRNICLDEFKNEIKRFSSSLGKVIVVGVNNFAEINLLPDFDQLVGVDLAFNAFDSLKTERTNILPVIANADSLPMPDNYFDEYCSFRTLFSNHTDLHSSLEEADRVTNKNGKIIISVPNGYFENNTIIKGMYDYENDFYDEDKPYQYTQKVISFFEDKKYIVQIVEITSEILILIQK